MSAQLYRCGIKTPSGAAAFVDVLADSGDAASTAALAKYPGAFIATIEPAPALLQPHLKGKVNDGALTASQAKAAGDLDTLKLMAA